MIAGHFGLAALAKSASPQTPLWALMLATVWLGAWLYGRAARGVTVPGSPPRTRAGLVGTLILAGGVAVLSLDVSGMLG